MHWIFFAISSVLFLAIANVLQKVLMKQEDSNALSYATVFQITCAIISGIAAFLNGFVMPPIAQMPINFILLGVLYGVGTVFAFKALKTLEASEVTIIAALRSIVTIISAVLLLGDVFNVERAVGTLLILTAIILVAKRNHRFEINKGIIYALGYALCFGLAVTNDVFILRHSDVLSFTAIGYLLPALFLLLLNPSIIRKSKHFFKPKVFSSMFLLSLFYTCAGISFYTALSLGVNASQMGPINQSSVVITVLLATLFLKERSNLVKKLICAVFVVVGVWFLT